MKLKRIITKELISLSKQYPVVTITGPRQAGKTTLAKMTFPKMRYANLEEPDVRAFAIEDPRSFLADNPRGMIIDEIQRAPELLSYIQAMVDVKNKNSLFILTGSQQLNLLGKVTQSLAGRTALLTLLPFSFKELKQYKYNHSLEEFIYNGFYPRVHDQKLNPSSAYKNYYQTYVERDLRQLINIKDINLFQKFVKLCAGRVGQLFDRSSLSNEVGVSTATISSWISILEASYIIYFLNPYFENFNKRVIKTPKLYFYDVGLATYLLGINSVEQIHRDPLKGLLFENMIVSELIKQQLNRGLDPNLYFYRDSNKNEVDVLLKSANNFIAIEIKSSQTFNKEYLKGINYFKGLSKNRLIESYLVYNGISQNRTDYKIINFKNIKI